MSTTYKFLQLTSLNPVSGDTLMTGEISRNDLEDFAKAFHDELNASLAMMTAIDHGCGEERFELLTLFHVPGEAKYVLVTTPVPAFDQVFPSLTPIFPNANWPEREVYDMFGLVPLGHPDPRPLIWKGGWPRDQFPLRKDFAVGERGSSVQRILHPVTEVEGEGVFEVSVGPIHAGIIEPGHFICQCIGDTLLALDAQLFFCHRGIEKMAENRNPMEALLLAERQCGTCSVSNAFSYCLAIERAAGMEIPPRARLLRVFFAEFERVYNHVNDVSAIAAGVGLAFVTQQGLRLKEELQRQAAALCGHRFLRNIFVPGGLRCDVDRKTLEAVTAVCEDAFRQLDQMVQIAVENSVFLDRLETTGVLTLHNARELRALGHAARASGVEQDTRIDHPYDGYADLPKFAIPTRKTGDVMARFRLRLDEMPISLDLMRSVIRAIPEGPVQTPFTGFPEKAWGLGATESARGENLLLIRGGKNNCLDRYAARTASYCNWPCISTTIRGNILPDFPLINKSFELCYADVDR